MRIFLMNSRNLKVVLMFLIIMALMACCCVFFAMMVGMSENIDTNKLSSTVITQGNKEETIVIIPVNGVITDQSVTDFWGNESPSMAQDIIQQIDNAQHDKNVRAILLQVNSPGGEVFASKSIYNKLKEFKSSGKTLVVQMQDMAASGGYFISAPADEIIASEVTTTGSIGVIVSGIDSEGFYEKLGLREYSVVNSKGSMKTLEGLDDENSEAYKILQSILDDVYDNFTEVVAEGRGLPINQVIQLADGRIYSGRQAKELNLVDTLGEDKTAREVVERRAGLSNPRYITYTTNSSPFSFYSMSLKRILLPNLYVMETLKPGISVEYLLKV